MDSCKLSTLKFRQYMQKILRCSYHQHLDNLVRFVQLEYIIVLNNCQPYDTDLGAGGMKTKCTGVARGLLQGSTPAASHEMGGWQEIDQDFDQLSNSVWRNLALAISRCTYHEPVQDSGRVQQAICLLRVRWASSRNSWRFCPSNGPNQVKFLPQNFGDRPFLWVRPIGRLF